ncbi:MAG: hypothetical protein HC897_15720 [Thermoanaerobaculia bacterium]|nr:hypothetical protein [Thermoanaerobaculia bacterium]
MAEMPERDELYVGYLPTTPPGIARLVRGAVLAILVVAAVIGGVLALAQKPFGSGVFEFGVERSFEGILHERPYPTLETEPGKHHYLVAQFKFGADAQVAGLDGQRVKLSGTLIHRDGQQMIEIVPGTIENLGPPAFTDEVRIEYGTMTLEGEIVDSKCYLGVMKPGSEKPHRDCAVRCISGGVPPIFLLREPGGPSAYLLLVGSDGRQLGKEVLGLVAEPLEITGEVVKIDNVFTLRAEPASFRRLS